MLLPASFVSPFPSIFRDLKSLVPKNLSNQNSAYTMISSDIGFISKILYRMLMAGVWERSERVYSFIYLSYQMKAA